MARLFIDGFETGDTKCWDGIVTGGTNLVSAGSIDAVGSYRKNEGNYAWECLFKNVSPSTPSTIFMKVNCKAETTQSYSGPSEIMGVANADGVQFLLCLEHPGYLSIRKGAGDGTQIAISTTQIPMNTTFIVEMKIVLGASGSIITKVNGVIDINFSGNVHNQAADTITKVLLGRMHQCSNWGFMYWDHFVVDDSDWIGDVSILPLIPNGAGGVTQLTPSSGANYTCVNAVPTSDAQNVSSNTPDQEDAYTKAAIATTWEVKSVQMLVRAKGEGTPACGGVEPMLRIAGTDYPGVRSVVPLGSYGNALGIWQNSPATSNPFTVSELNSLEIGARLVA